MNELEHQGIDKGCYTMADRHSVVVSNSARSRPGGAALAPFTSIQKMPEATLVINMVPISLPELLHQELEVEGAAFSAMC